MIVSVVSEKVIDKNQHSLIIKTLTKQEIEGNFLNLIKNIFETPTASIIHNDKGLIVFLLKQRTQKRCSLFLLFYSTFYWVSFPVQ